MLRETEQQDAIGIGVIGWGVFDYFSMRSVRTECS